MMFPMDDSLGASAGNIIQCRCVEAYEVSKLIGEEVLPEVEDVVETEEKLWETDVRNMIDAGPNTPPDNEQIGKRITDDIIVDPKNKIYFDSAKEWLENQAIKTEYVDMVNDGKTLTRDQLNIYREAVRRNRLLDTYLTVGSDLIEEQTYDRLRKVRSFGKETMSAWYNMSYLSQQKVYDTMEEAKESFPTDWIRQSSNSYIKLEINDVAGGRARYLPGRGTMYVDAQYPPTYFHELGHRMEDVNVGQVVGALGGAKKNVGQLCFEWREARRLGEQSVWIGDGIPSHEIGFLDKFFKKYVGRDYGNDWNEVLSMGMEYLNTSSLEMITGDPGHYRFIVGLLAGV